MQVINLAGGPGSGKSTTAAGLFSLMKLHTDYKVELVTEFAKELVYEARSLDDQLYITAQQNRRLRRLAGKVDFAITDSPLFLGAIYAAGWSGPFNTFLKSLWDNYHNVTFFIERVKEYRAYGRVQTEQEAIIKDNEILDYMQTEVIPFRRVAGDASAPDTILRMIVPNRSRG